MASLGRNIVRKFRFRNDVHWSSCNSASTQASATLEKTDLPQMPACGFQPGKYEGPSMEEVLRIRRTNVSPAILAYYKKPVLVHQGHMQWLFDASGKRYLDMYGGIVTVSVGHCHPKVTKALVNQAGKLWHTTNIYLHPAIHEYTEKLVSKLPGDLKVVYFTNSGSEANDLAVMMARLYTGAFDVVALRNCYHGGSPQTMGITAMGTWRYSVPTGFGMHHTMNPDVYRGPWGGAGCRDSPVQTTRKCDCAPGQCKAGDMYAGQLEDVLKSSLPNGRVGAFISEQIQGGGGTVQFPKNFMKKAYKMIKERGGVCISDEVQTAFGRTGTHYWGFEGSDVMPDIVTTAKGIGNGFPLAAVITTPEISKCLTQALHFNTFGGNPLACAVGSAVLDVIDEEKCQDKAHRLGTYLLEELAKLREEFQVVGDVRGKGFMTGLELVEDKASRSPLNEAHVNSIWEDIKDMGVLVGKGGLYRNVFRIKPPMCITAEDIDYTVAVFRRALQNYTKG